MITTTQAADLAKLLRHIRPTWDLHGTQAKLLERSAQHPQVSLPLLIIEATQAASVPTNRTPEVLTMDGPHRDPTFRVPAPQIPPCPAHGGTTMRDDAIEGQVYGCCFAERVADEDSTPPRPERPDHSTHIAQARAALNRPKETSR